jgi:hypothetical protein
MTDDPKCIVVRTLEHILVPAAESECVELAVLYVAYVKAVTKAGGEALQPAPFAEVVKGYCRALEITANLSGDRVHLVGVKLIA